MSDSTPQDDLLTPKELAAKLKVHPDTLERWRRAGSGPDFIPLTSGGIRYDPAVVKQWLARRTCTNSAQAYELTKGEAVTPQVQQPGKPGRKRKLAGAR
jgi:predicted DNA-binding transcriptional regulator AlpA